MQEINNPDHHIAGKTTLSWDGTKYTIITGETVRKIVPFPTFGQLFYQGQEIFEETFVEPGDLLEYYPESITEPLNWEIQVWPSGLKAVAKVKRQQVGRYVLCEDIPEEPILKLEELASWRDMPECEIAPREEDFLKQLRAKGVIYGIKPSVWAQMLAVRDSEDIVVAECTPAIPTIHSDIVDFVGKPLDHNQLVNGKIDYFACKLRIFRKDDLLARKIPGKEGTPGINIFGQPIPVETLRDFEFKQRKNVYISEDGLELRAACDGIPIRSNTYDYLVENVYVARDIDLTTGSVDFPGDVIIVGNVNEGFYVYSGGKIQIQGNVSGAELKAEAGLQIGKNIIASKITVGEKHVFRSKLYKGLLEINEELPVCIAQVEKLQAASGQKHAGTFLKILLEKKFTELPKKIEEMEKLLQIKDPEILSDELEIAIRTLKRFLVGIGPLQLSEIGYLKSALKIVDHFLTSKEGFIPLSVLCETRYVQNSTIHCAGDFTCSKGVYNSYIDVQGNTKITGVFRGGELYCRGDIYIREVGGSAVSATTIRADKNSKLKIDFCHANVKFFIGKEIIRIDDNVQKLDIYREKGILRVEKLKWDNLP